MKKYTILALALVLTASLFAGCRSRKPNMTPTSMPTTVPTTQATTAPTTAPTTMPTTVPTEETKETIDHGNGPRDEVDTTDSTAAESRGAMPRVK